MGFVALKEREVWTHTEKEDKGQEDGGRDWNDPAIS